MKTDEEIWASLGFHESLEASVETTPKPAIDYVALSSPGRLNGVPLDTPTWKMYATRGTNLIGVGWMNGTLRCAFASKTGPRFYLYPGVPEAEFEKLAKSPYPDRLFAKNIKNKFKGERDR